VYIAKSDEAPFAHESLDDFDCNFCTDVCHRERCAPGTIISFDDFVAVELDALREHLQFSRVKGSGERMGGLGKEGHNL
jgi:hypothetical protein